MWKEDAWPWMPRENGGEAARGALIGNHSERGVTLLRALASAGALFASLIYRLLWPRPLFRGSFFVLLRIW
jgi:hypothetical protein